MQQCQNARLAFKHNPRQLLDRIGDLKTAFDEALYPMTRPIWAQQPVLLAVLALAIILRLIGVVANNEANDPHLEVSQIMAYEHRMPAATEVWESFQPKLYHATVAAFLMVLPRKLPEVLQMRVAQAVSGAAGIATLFLLLGFLCGLPLAARTQQLAFALVALNPKMIATSIQATNDAFVILFATLALTAGFRFFKAYERRDFAWMTAGVLLACISKGSGLPLVIAVLCTFAAALLRPTISRRRIFGYAAALVLAFIVFVPVAGEYWARYQQTGNAFWSSQAPSPPPRFLEETFVKPKRPGITSVVGGYFTFRLVDLLEEPLVTNGLDVYPPHRTSLWSFAYGSAHSNHYDNYPPTWALGNAGVLWLLRTIFIVALVPTALLVIGTARGVLRTAADLFSGAPPSDWSARVLLAVVTSGYVAFLMLYSYQYRDFGTMKPIFIYPVMAPLMAYYALELQRIQNRGKTLAASIATGSAALLCVAYLADSVVLLVHLILQRLHLM